MLSYKCFVLSKQKKKGEGEGEASYHNNFFYSGCPKLPSDHGFFTKGDLVLVYEVYV